MAKKFMLIEVPDYSKVYIFGSYLHSNYPNDIDILIVYDEEKCSAQYAYRNHLEIIDRIEKEVNLSAHVTMLTLDEEKETRFLKLIGGKSISEMKIFNK